METDIEENSTNGDDLDPKSGENNGLKVIL